VIDIFVIKAKIEAERECEILEWSVTFLTHLSYNVIPAKKEEASVKISCETRYMINRSKETELREEEKKIERLISSSHSLVENRKLKLRHTIRYAN